MLGLTKQNLIDLVDSIKNLFLLKNNGTLEAYTEKLVTMGATNIVNLQEGNVFRKVITANTTFVITNTKNNVSHSFTLYLEVGATLRTVAYPTSVKWESESIPELKVNKTYILTFSTINGGTTWFANWGEY